MPEPRPEEQRREPDADAEPQPVDLARPVREHDGDRHEQRERREVQLEGETREHRHEEHGTAALPLEYHEQAPEQRDVDDRQHVLRPDLAAVQHRPRCGREEGGGSEPDERAEARPEDDVREADRDDREHTDERSRRERVVTKAQWNRQ